MIKLPLKTRLSIVKDAVLRVMKKPSYIALWLVTVFFMAGMVIWSLNVELLYFVFFQSPLTLLGKVDFFVDGYKSLFGNFNSVLSVSILLFSTLFGLNIALLTYVLRRIGLNAVPKKSGGTAFVFAILGGGCIACGTSLLTPLLISLGVFGGTLLRDLGSIFNLLGSIFLLYSIYKLSVAAQTVNAKRS